jgi:hypothetical protein
MELKEFLETFLFKYSHRTIWIDRAVNTLYLGYKNLWVHTVQGNNIPFFSDLY